MTDLLLQAQNHLLAPANIEAKDLSRVLDSILGHNVDAADLYFQSTRHEAWVLEDSIVKEGSFNVDSGVGVRAISGEKTGFAYLTKLLFLPWNKPPVLPAVLPVKGNSSRYRLGGVASLWRFILLPTLWIP